MRKCSSNCKRTDGENVQVITSLLQTCVRFAERKPPQNMTGRMTTQPTYFL